MFTQPPSTTTDTAHTAARAHDKHAGHDPEAFRRRFWLTLLLTIPVVASSEMVMEWFGYEIDGVAWVGPVLGTFIFAWGGQPFLVRRRRRGAQPATRDDAADLDGDHRRLGGVDVDQHRVVRPRVLVGAGAARDDHAARALAGDEGDRTGAGRPGRAGRAPARRSRADRDRRWDRAGPDRRPGRRRPCVGPVRSAGPGRWADHRGRGRARRVDDHRRIATGPQDRRRSGGRRDRVDRLVVAGGDRRRRARTPRSPGSSASSPTPRPAGAAPRCSPIASPRCCSTWRPGSRR